MKLSTLLTIIFGIAALGGGFFVGGGNRRSVGTDPAGDRGVGPMEEQAGDGNNGERINPGLLKELRSQERILRLIAGLEAGECEAALLRAVANDDDDAVGAIIAKWSEVDVEGALGFFLKRGRVTLPMEPRSSMYWGHLLFRALVDRNPREAVKAAARFPTEERCLDDVLRMVARDTPKIAVECALEYLDSMVGLPFFGLDGELDQALVIALAKKEPFGAGEAEALKRFLRMGSGTVDPFEVWKALPTEARARNALTLVPTSDDGSQEATELYTMALKRFEEPSEDGKSPGSSVQFLDTFSRRLFEEKGFEGSLAWVEKNAGALNAGYAIQTVFRDAVGAKVSQDEVLAAFETLRPGPMKSAAATSLMASLFGSDHLAGLSFARQLPPAGSTGDILRQLGVQWSAQSPEEARAAALEIPAGFHANVFVGQAAASECARQGGPEALEWARQFPDDRRAAAITGAGEAWISADGAAALAYFTEHSDVPQRDALFMKAAFRCLASADAERAPWLAGLGEGDRALVREVIRESATTLEWQSKAMADLEVGR